MNRRAGLVRAHRWASLVAALLWSVQASTGIFAVFHWELDDATVAGEARALDLEAIERRAMALAAPGQGLSVDSIWTSAGAANRFDIFLDAQPPAKGQVVRVDGTGNILRVRADGERRTNGGWVETLVVLHQSLLAGDAGRWIIGGSGILLLANIVAGALLAWPRAGQWRRALLPRAAPAGAPRLYAWHRAIGLWAMLPAACVVCAGVLLAFEATTEQIVAASAVEPPALLLPAGTAPRVGLAESVRTALARYPGAIVSGIGFPSAESAWWAVRLRQPGEWRRAYGKTRVFVSALDGSVGADFDALAAPPGRRFVDSLFSFHTGEIAGRTGRLGALAVGVWLLAMTLLGCRLWWERRRPRRQPEPRAPAA